MRVFGNEVRSRFYARLRRTLQEIKAIDDSEIDTSDISELDDDFWHEARSVLPENYLRVDKDTLEWFKTQGQGYESRMNAILKDYVSAHGGQTPKQSG